jgi:hypothetical protein
MNLRKLLHKMSCIHPQKCSRSGTEQWFWHYTKFMRIRVQLQKFIRPD